MVMLLVTVIQFWQPIQMKQNLLLLEITNLAQLADNNGIYSMFLNENNRTVNVMNG